MSRILIVGDVHLRDHPAANNTPDAIEDVWHSLEYIATISHEFDATVFAGDVFDFKNPAKTSHALVMRALRTFGSMHNAYAVAGNHDLSADRIESLTVKQPLGVLIEAGVIEHLDGWMTGGNMNLPLPVYGRPWVQQWMDFDARMSALAPFRDPDALDATAPRLLVTHAPIFPEAVSQGVPYEFLPLDGPYGLHRALGKAPASVYYGHIHDFHGVHTAAEVPWITYANAGSLNRARFIESDITRTVSVTTWDSSTGEFEFLPIPDQAPAARIFRFEAATTAKAERRDLDAFLQHVGRSSIDIATTSGLIEHVRSLDAPVSVREKAVDLITRVEA